MIARVGCGGSPVAEHHALLDLCGGTHISSICAVEAWSCLGNVALGEGETFNNRRRLFYLSSRTRHLEKVRRLHSLRRAGRRELGQGASWALRFKASWLSSFLGPYINSCWALRRPVRPRPVTPLRAGADALPVASRPAGAGPPVRPAEPTLIIVESINQLGRLIAVKSIIMITVNSLSRR